MLAAQVQGIECRERVYQECTKNQVPAEDRGYADDLGQDCAKFAQEQCDTSSIIAKVPYE